MGVLSGEGGNGTHNRARCRAHQGRTGWVESRSRWDAIPRGLLGLFQRERRLLGLLARAARDAIVPSVCAILDRDDVTPGLADSIQTFGSYAANFHPHVRALITDPHAAHRSGSISKMRLSIRARLARERVEYQPR